ncbi:MAG: hypothetical protein J5J06_04850 [Phycisphaerae bacterium]|nr:hypothetical protein [Phycisphaerae bacterium]
MSRSNRTLLGFSALVLLLATTPNAVAQRAGGFSLVPIGVVGGNPSGTVIAGNEITIPGGGVDVMFEIRGHWGGEPGLLLGTAGCTIDATTGFSSGVGAPLAWKNQGIAGTGSGTQTEGAFVPDEYCEVSMRYGCPSPGTPPSGQPVCDGDPLGDGDCVVNPRYILAPEEDTLYAVAYLIPNYEFIVVSQMGGVPFTGTNEVMGIAIIRVPIAAAGIYAIDFVRDPLNTYMADQDVFDIPLGPATGSFANVTPGVIRIPTGACCDFSNNSCTENATAATCVPPQSFRAGYDCSDSHGDGFADACECCLNSASCDDGDACTIDRCTTTPTFCGVCTSTVNFDTTAECCDPYTGQVASADDGNLCTEDTCSITPLGSHRDDGRGTPVHTPIPDALCNACCDAFGDCANVAAEQDCDGTFFAEIACESPSMPACPTPTLGACCDEMSGVCTETSAAACGSTRTFTLGAHCSEITCEPPTGACCNATEGTCTETAGADCDCPFCTWHLGQSCDDVPDPCAAAFIPAASEWGLAVLALVLLITAKVYFGRTERPARALS